MVSPRPPCCQSESSHGANRSPYRISCMMGCASSGPVGKVAESVKDLASKEGKAVQEFGAATKDTLISGVNHVNEVVGSTFKSAENEVVNLTSKATSFLGHAEDETKDMKKEAEQLESNVSENVNEAISDAETVVMSEVGNMHNDVGDLSDEVKGHLEKETEKMITMDGDNLILEDIEHFDHLGEAVDKNVKKVEEKLMDVEVEDLKNSLTTAGDAKKEE
ncbi:uncharacterized protein LOC123671526 [Harmonia axyridis]|uniref:uncharacterized protein LOC123671526 n=1 Tax=Harmonia axyridis TaxID=115357 RepID=UPI001E277FCE|nr:uncharacterized protein LOC123671526 [Harmonia axyridis]